MIAPQPKHTALTQFAVKDDCLAIGGIPLTRLTQRVGKTPYYAYDRRMKMGGGPKQFGVDVEAVPAMLTQIGKLDINFVGFHIFSRSQNLKVDAIQETHEKTLQLGWKLAENAPSPVRMLNIGGGFHHHLAATGNFGQVIRKNYPAIIGNKVRGTQQETVSIVGLLYTFGLTDRTYGNGTGNRK